MRNGPSKVPAGDSMPTPGKMICAVHRPKRVPLSVATTQARSSASRASSAIGASSRNHRGRARNRLMVSEGDGEGEVNPHFPGLLAIGQVHGQGTDRALPARTRAVTYGERRQGLALVARVARIDEGRRTPFRVESMRYSALATAR